MYSFDSKNNISFNENWQKKNCQLDESGLGYVDDTIYYVNRHEAGIWGSRFLSGFQDERMVCFHSDGVQTSVTGVQWCSELVQVALPITVQIASTVPICLSGPICRDPAFVSSFVRQYPSNRIFVCPVVEELEALGALVIGLLKREEKCVPCRISFYEECKEEIDGEVIQEYDDTLKHDNLGRIATALRFGVPVINQVRKGIGISPFYDRVLTLNLTQGKEKIYLIRNGDLKRFFPKEPPSLWMEAASCVPVEGYCSKEFRDISGLDVEKVVFFAMSDFQIGASEFMNFLLMITDKRIVASAPLKMMSELGSSFLFRYNKAYKI